MGRRRIYFSDADRARAYRARVADARAAETAALRAEVAVRAKIRTKER
jgi:hypothetical protein